MSVSAHRVPRMAGEGWERSCSLPERGTLCQHRQSLCAWLGSASAVALAGRLRCLLSPVTQSPRCAHGRVGNATQTVTCALWW